MHGLYRCVLTKMKFLYKLPITITNSIIFFDIHSSTLFITLWNNIIVLYSILSFIGHIQVFLYSYIPIFGVDFGRCRICLSALTWIFDISFISVAVILPHTSNPCIMAGMKHVSNNFIFIFISSDPT